MRIYRKVSISMFPLSTSTLPEPCLLLHVHASSPSSAVRNFMCILADTSLAPLPHRAAQVKILVHILLQCAHEPPSPHVPSSPPQPTSPYAKQEDASLHSCRVEVHIRPRHREGRSIFVFSWLEATIRFLVHASDLQCPRVSRKNLLVRWFKGQ